MRQIPPVYSTMKVPAKKKLAAAARLTLLIFFSLLIFSETHAESLPTRNYTTADGLAHDRVNEIVRDSRGFLWFCTGEGLSRFDGYEFKNYTQAHGLPHRSVNDLLEMPDGNYLVATGDGLAVFDPNGTARKEGATETDETPMFRTFRAPNAPPHHTSVAVEELLRTRDGEIWAATLGGLYRLTARGDEWRFERYESEVLRGKGSEFVRLVEDRRGGIWIGAPTGLYRLAPETRKAVQILDKSGVVSLLEDREGRVWVGGGSGTNGGLNLFTFSPETGEPVLARNFTTKDGLTGNDWLNALLETGDGRVLVGLPNALVEFLPAADGESSFRTLFQTDIVSLAEDGEANIWIGTSINGAYKLTRRGFVIFNEKDKLPPQPTISSVFAGNGSEIFIASGASDLLRFDGEKFTAVKPAGMKPRSWGWNQLDFRARNGEWWIPTGAGVLRYPPVSRFEDLARTTPLKLYTTDDGLWSNAVFRLFEDSRGDVWISMLGSLGDTGNSLARWERATEKLHAYTTAEGLPHANGATAFAEDRAGNVWIGFYAGGLGRMRGGKFQFFPVPEAFPTGLINSIHLDRDGRLWIAVSNSGLVRVDDPAAENPQFLSLTVAEGLSSNQATCLAEDNSGRIYVGTGRGVTRVEPQSGRLKTYTQADGLPGSYVRTCGRDADGSLWFVQKNNLVRLAPAIEESGEPPPIFVADLRANGVRVRKFSELGEVAVTGLELAPDQGQIQVDFFALSFDTGETLRYQYKLYGTNDEWSAPTTQRTVNLNLAPGVYRFLVRAVNSEGLTSPAPASISFTIARPVWQRWWFLTLGALVIVGFIYAIYRYRLARLLELERVRTRIATDLHDDIGSSLSQIAILSEVVRQKINSENGAGEPLKIIAGTSREMVDSMSDIVWAINPQKDHLSDLVQRMRRFAGDTLESCDIGYQFIAPEQMSGIRLGADQRREIYLIFKECVNNMVKHAHARRAIIEVNLESNFLTVEVADDGRGFDAGEFAAGDYDGYGGNGLPSMRKRAETLGGTFVVESEKGKGARVLLRIPVGSRWKKLNALVRGR